MNRIKLICRLAFVLLLALALCAGVYAAESQDVGTVTIECVFSEAPVPSLPFSLYHAADVSGSKITMDADFAAFPVDLKTMDVDSWNALALTVKSYVLAQGIVPDASGQSDANGVLTFDGLSAGLYLVVGEGAAVNGMYYSSAPFFVLLPRADSETGEAIYDLKVHPKLSAKPQEEGTITRKVLKIWKDTGYEDERPNEITVQLYCDGKLYDTVKLSDANNWRYTWEKLPDNHDYTVVEEELVGYTAAIEQQGITFLLTNTSINIMPPGPNPPKPNPPSDHELPKTGLNWWPVLIFAVLGLLCLAAGLLWRKDSAHEEKK